MSEFITGESKIGNVQVTNNIVPTPWNGTCRLIVGSSYSNYIPFSFTQSGQVITVPCPITMPSTPGNYNATARIFNAGVMLKSVVVDSITLVDAAPSDWDGTLTYEATEAYNYIINKTCLLRVFKIMAVNWGPAAEQRQCILSFGFGTAGSPPTTYFNIPTNNQTVLLYGAGMGQIITLTVINVVDPYAIYTPLEELGVQQYTVVGRLLRSLNWNDYYNTTPVITCPDYPGTYNWNF